MDVRSPVLKRCLRFTVRETFFGKPFAADGFMQNGSLLPGVCQSRSAGILLRAANTELYRSDNALKIYDLMVFQNRKP